METVFISIHKHIELNRYALFIIPFLVHFNERKRGADVLKQAKRDDIQFIICSLLEIQFGPVRSYIDPARYACIFPYDTHTKQTNETTTATAHVLLNNNEKCAHTHRISFFFLSMGMKQKANKK